MAALLEPAPVDDVRVVAFREDADRLEVVREHGDARRGRVDRRLLVGRLGVLVVGPAHARGRVGEPADAHLQEDRVERDQGRAVAERVVQLAVGEQRDGRVAEPDGHGLRAARVHRVVPADLLEPLHVLEGREVLRFEPLELGRVARGEREELLHVQPQEPLGCQHAQRTGHHRAVVGAVHPVARVPEAAHERVVRTGDPGQGPPAVRHRVREAEARRVRHDDVERVLGAPAVGDRVGEPVDHVQVVDRRARVCVRQEQRRRVRVGRGDVDEVDRLAVDLGDEVRVRVEPLLDGSPVERAPGVDGLLEVVVRRPVVPRVARGGLREAGVLETSGQVVQLGLGDLDAEGSDVGVRHRDDAMVAIGQDRSA